MSCLFFYYNPPNRTTNKYVLDNVELVKVIK